jgi:hypothetical protein
MDGVKSYILLRQYEYLAIVVLVISCFVLNFLRRRHKFRWLSGIAKAQDHAEGIWAKLTIFQTVAGDLVLNEEHRLPRNTAAGRKIDGAFVKRISGNRVLETTYLVIEDTIIDNDRLRVRLCPMNLLHELPKDHPYYKPLAA